MFCVQCGAVFDVVCGGAGQQRHFISVVFGVVVFSAVFSVRCGAVFDVVCSGVGLVLASRELIDTLYSSYDWPRSFHSSAQ